MSDVSDWSPIAGNNDDPSPDGFPEGMFPSQVNDASREVMAAVRRFYDDLLDGTITVQQATNAINATLAANSSLLQGNNSAYHLNRNNHTGTQLMNTISNAGDLALLDLVSSNDVVAGFLASLLPNPTGGSNFTWACFGVQEGNAQTYCMTALRTGTISIGGVIADDGIRFTLTRDAVLNTDGADVDIDRPGTGSNFWESGSSGSWNGSFQNISVTAGDRIYFNNMSSYGPGASGACVQVRTGNDCILPPVN